MKQISLYFPVFDAVMVVMSLTSVLAPVEMVAQRVET